MMMLLKSTLMSFLALLIVLSASTQPAAALRPHDVYAEEAKLMLVEDKRESTTDPQPPFSDCTECKRIAGIIRDLVGRIYTANFWDQKMQDALILKDLRHGTAVEENGEDVDVVRMAAAMVEVATATANVKKLLDDIANLVGTDSDTLNEADAKLRQIMLILTPDLSPDPETKAGSFPAAFGNLGVAMRKALDHFKIKKNEEHFNTKFEYNKRAMETAVRSMTGRESDMVHDVEMDEVALIPMSSANNIKEWVHGIAQMVSEQHGFFWDEPMHSSTTSLINTGPWYKLIGYCSRKLIDPATSAWIRDPVKRGLLDWMLLLDRVTYQNSIMAFIWEHWKSRQVPEESTEDEALDPLVPDSIHGRRKRVKMITLPAVDWV